MAEHDESNFGNADGGGIPDVGNDGSNPEPVTSAIGATDPASFGKRGRGRPRKDASGDSSGTGTAGQRPGKEKSQGQKKLDVSLFARQLQGAHAMLAMVTKNPVWAIDEKAAETLAQSLIDVMSHHSININPATVSYMKLIGVCAAIYGPKLLTLKMQADQKKREQNNTIDMPQ